MRMCFFIAMCCILFSADAPARNDKQPENKYVKCTIALHGKPLRAGTTAELAIILKPQRGIHVNGAPPVNVKLDSTDMISEVGRIDIPLVVSTGFVDTQKPIILPFTLSQNAKSGPLTVTGTLTYYYCSDTEGWCSRFKQSIKLTAMVKE